MRAHALLLLLLGASAAAAQAPRRPSRASRVALEQAQDAPGDGHGGALAQLLRAIAQRWEQQQKWPTGPVGGRAASALAVAQWQDALAQLARAEPSLVRAAAVSLHSTAARTEGCVAVARTPAPAAAARTLHALMRRLRSRSWQPAPTC